MAEADRRETRVGETLAAPFSVGIAPPETPAPVGAIDTHHHIFDDRFFGTDGKPLGQSATVADYRLFKRRIGIDRSIIVAPSTYGTDNSCLIDALGQFGTDVARGVVLVDPDIGDDALDHMHDRGVRGMRFYLAKNRIPSPDELRSIGARAADRGWSLLFVGNREREVFVEWFDVLRTLPCPIVIDHFGWAPQPAGRNSQTADTMRRLLDMGHAYAKLSGVYLSSQVGFPTYSDIDDLAISLVEGWPERMIWGSDWPHPVAGAQKPDGGRLFDQLTIWAPDAEIRHRILIDNPERLYWAD